MVLASGVVSFLREDSTFVAAFLITPPTGELIFSALRATLLARLEMFSWTLGSEATSRART